MSRTRLLFGRYEDRGLMGTSMGHLHDAIDTATGRRVALKVFWKAADRDSEEVREAGRIGAEIQEELSRHSRVVPKIYEREDAEDASYVAMEYVEGEDLSAVLERGPIERERALQIAIDICEFLAIAHGLRVPFRGEEAHGFVHGDITPRNLRLDGSGTVRVLDFGIAKVLKGTRRRTENAWLDTVYCSPERLPDGKVDERSDLWSAAVLLFHMLAGRVPYRGGAASGWQEVADCRIEHGYLEAEPEPIRRILRKALNPDPDRRYAGAAQLAADLQAFRRGEPTLAEVEPIPAEPRGERTIRIERWAAAGDSTPDGPAADAATPDGAAAGDGASRRSAARGGDRSGAVARGIGERGTGAHGTRAGGAHPYRRTPPSREAALRTLTAGRTFALLPRLVIAAAAVSALIVGGGLATGEIQVAQAGARLEKRLPLVGPEKADSLRAAWGELSKRSRLGIGLARVRGPLAEWFDRQGERIISAYRSDAPGIREGDWERARRCFTWAVEVGTATPKRQARILYCEAQTLRIRAENVPPRRSAQAKGDFGRAAALFEQASRLDARWPDPLLGLARVAVYGLDDVDRAAAALEAARTIDYTWGRREKALLADGYLRRAKLLWRRSGDVKDSPQEVRFLEEGIRDCGRALDLYGGILEYENVSRNVRECQNLREQLDERLEWIRNPDPPESSRSWWDRLMGRP